MGRIVRKKPLGRPKTKQSDHTDPASKAGGAAKTPQGASPPRPTARGPVAYPGKRHVDAAVQFLREVRVELRKVTWPSRKQTIGSTTVVIIIVLMISFFLGLVDIGLSSLVKTVLQ